MDCKHVKFIIIILMSLLVPRQLCSQIGSFDEPFSIVAYTGIGITDANIKVGIPFQRGDAKLVGLPVAIGVKGNVKLNENLSIRLDFNFIHKGVYYYNKASQATGLELEYHRRTSTKIRTMFGFNYYYRTTTKSQRYFLLALGSKFVSRKYTVDGKPADLFYEFPNLTINFDNKFINPAIRLAFGFNRQISSRLFLNGEFGIGSNPIQLGIGMKL